MASPNFPYGYGPFTPCCAQPNPPSGVIAGPVHHMSFSTPTPSASWDSKNTNRYDGQERANGDLDKRHLDTYHIERALNNISQTSIIISDFARRHCDCLDRISRFGLTLSTLPGMVEVEDMMAKSRLQLDSLSKIREIVISQRVAFDQQAAEQTQQHKAYFAKPSSPTRVPEPDDGKVARWTICEEAQRSRRSSWPLTHTVARRSGDAGPVTQGHSAATVVYTGNYC